jgi:NADH:ubiquinone oxidoreductase subunit 4 (subunit M)
METLIILPIIGAIILYYKPEKRWALGISIVILMEVIRKQVGMDRESGEWQYVVRYE